jgi:hypothetical protein
MAAHGGCGRAQQKPQITPLDRQLRELQHRRRRELRIQVVGVESNRRQRHARLHAPLELQQLDLQVRGRRELGLLLFEPPELCDLARLRALGSRSLGLVHAGILHHGPAGGGLKTPLRKGAQTRICRDERRDDC